MIKLRITCTHCLLGSCESVYVREPTVDLELTQRYLDAHPHLPVTKAWHHNALAWGAPGNTNPPCPGRAIVSLLDNE